MNVCKKILFLIGIFCLFSAFPVKAISFTPPPFKDASYLGKYVGVSVKEPIEIKAGETKEVTVKIKNVGKSVWEISGKNYVSAYTVNKNYRASVFTNSTWISSSNPTKITKRTASGETAEIKIKLKAPTKIGNYREDFYLAAENKTWIKSSYFYLDIKVVQNMTATISNDEDNDGNDVGQLPDEAEKSSKEYKAHLSAMTAYKMTANGGDKVGFIVMYTNTGSTTWNNFLWQEAGSAGAATGSVKANIADESWLSPVKIYQGSASVKSGESTRIEFYFRAPRLKGEYVARFQLTANNHTLDGGTLEIPITVLQDAPYSYQEPSFVSNRVLVAEPSVRIGLYKAVDEVKFKSDFSYEVYSGSVLQGTLFGGETAVMRYAGGNYYFNSPSLNFTGQERLRLVPYDFNNYFTLLDYERYVSWKGNKNFNVYRGIMEFKYSPKSDAPYVINELPMDSYIAGIAETSNGAAMEYIKAILVAARSYAYYHLYNGVPADQRTFDLYATTADQLYLGYNSEVLMPRVVQAQRATYGEMVTYAGSPIITPYFGHSDGKTRTWKSVWGGTDKDWLQPVICIYDEGQSMFGHGVGMSAWDASQRADKDGWTYNQLLQYYYQGTSLEKIY